MSSGHQRITWRRNIAENFNRLSRVHERYRQTTDGRTTTYSEHEHEFTFAKKTVGRLFTMINSSTPVYFLYTEKMQHYLKLAAQQPDQQKPVLLTGLQLVKTQVFLLKKKQCNMQSLTDSQLIILEVPRGLIL